MPELIVLDRVFIGAGRVVMGALSIDTSGGGSGFASGITGTVRCVFVGRGVMHICPLARCRWFCKWYAAEAGLVACRFLAFTSIPTITDNSVSSADSFLSESVQTLFVDGVGH